MDGVDYDVGSAITSILAPQTRRLGKPVLYRTQPPLVNEQVDEPYALALLEHGYRTYQRDPATLFHGAPGWMRSEFGF